MLAEVAATRAVAVAAGEPLTRIGGAVGRPFVTIARMDIVVEPSAVDGESVTYKAIALHEPSLDDVFLAETGRSLEGAGDEEEETPDQVPVESA